MSPETSIPPYQQIACSESRESQPATDEGAELYARYLEQQRRLHCPSCGESAEVF